MATDDRELLRAFARDRSGDAFARLVGRHEDWLYVAARRRLRDDHLADDARQTVLLLLAEKAGQLAAQDATPIAAWLFHTMHFTCASLLRTRGRRARHEASAARRDSEHDGPDGSRVGKMGADDAALAALEETIARLPPRDREAVVRRFYQREDYASVGRALGVSAEAARKRVGRVLAGCRASMSLDGVDARPAALLDGPSPAAGAAHRVPTSDEQRRKIESIAKGALVMVQQMEAMAFAVMTAEFFVRSVEDNLDFFEKLGFRRHFVEALDAAGLAPRASLRGGHARIWLRRATDDNPPAPGVLVYVWLDGGEPAVIRHREAIAAQGVAVNQFFYDGALMNFTVTSPDGYRIGFFSTYRPHTFDPTSDG